MFNRWFNAEHTSNANRRLLFRTLIFVLLTCAGFSLIEYLIQQSHDHGSNFLMKYPEFISLMKAVSIQTFIELSVLWIRVISEPRIDTQAAAEVALKDPKSASLVYLTHKLSWAFRVASIMLMTNLL
jgi:hypothetical protein